jgi:DNA-binding response OmpR family regulator
MPLRPEPRVLVVEDDPRIRQLLVDLLVDDGYDVRAVEDGEDALVATKEFRPDLVLLDGELPGVDGWSVARRLRQVSDLPIVFVTGSDSRERVRAGFDAGGDDYVLKPFDPEELSSRVKAILRRSGHAVPQVWEVDGLVVDSGARTATVNGVPVALTSLEFDLLEVLLRSRSQVVGKQRLLQRVWGYDWAERDDHLVEVHVSSLRKKLETHGGRVIHTVRGAGYILRPGGPP